MLFIQWLLATNQNQKILRIKIFHLLRQGVTSAKDYLNDVLLHTTALSRYLLQTVTHRNIPSH